MKVKPLKNRLLIKLVEKENETKSGIILAGSEKGETNLAQVVETADCYDEDYEVLLKGDKIVIRLGVGTNVNFDGNEYYIVDQKDVLALVR